MADQKEEAKITGQETITPAEGKKDELSEQDLSKASGGALFIKFVTGPENISETQLSGSLANQVASIKTPST
jgi:hypothetical protein